ncbi:protein translocase subunit secA [Desulfonispora thiosulfatigenes DSM 11270]|uniref:Protein translocase subunit SecA n=1 Tax=Desulfonispora thiosulfatigenes DSM 11270 TaxID=656914 RepID=A0A1W1UX80_DESTI|nr:preprotein translocase subunit SecA [Desulfonispora thiosulfatigenes]SMB85692.1 protein translocase subunit secA [Desulfonispora thiosulfatigenes DSM 11270]
MLNFLKGILDDNKKEIKKLQKTVDKINSFEQTFEKYTDEDLSNMTVNFKERLNKGETLNDILPEAFAVTREAAKRVLGMRHYDVQMMGGIVLHRGRIAEMKTGEGKTLVATLPTYLNALTGKGVHVVTVNDYLATRDSEWMGKLYNFLGLEVGLIVHGLSFDQRKQAYNADITYGTNNEFGFDYLRDNMVMYQKNMVQRDLNYALVDEVDSILIDEARTPLIISGPSDKPKELYATVAKIIPRLKNEDDYTIDEKQRIVNLTEEGNIRVEKMLGIENLFDEANIELSHHVNQALKAYTLMKKDKDYVVKDGEVIIVDEFTGRLMFGRRYSDGLHQAIEAKEGVKIEKESQTLATITFQNYFRMYQKVSGMTGTAKTEEDEFMKIYGMDVVIIPTNKELKREDKSDIILRTEGGKYDAVVEEIEQRHITGQPVLVGTISIENSELLSNKLKKKGIPHQVLNAKFHEQEAEIVAGAGQKGMVTIATNMAGRGTDIVLGEGVKELGGLCILGTERHESRRIDNQLRGRAGRQGDPGLTRFYISMEDELMRLFGAENIMGLMDKLGMDDSVPIENKIISRGIENAQKRVEGRNFDIRKNVLEYDDVLNKQREVIYNQRKKVLNGENIKESIIDMIEKVVDETISVFAGEATYPEEWDLEGLLQAAEQKFLPDHDIEAEKLSKLEATEVRELLKEEAIKYYEKREEELGEEELREVERLVLLKVVDAKWMDHLDAMDQLRRGIHLRAYGQRDPLLEYKFEGYDMFNQMIRDIQEETVRYVYRVNVAERPEERQNVTENKYEEEKTKNPVRVNKIGRNDDCPCGSGKKYKKCCGKEA